MGSLLKKSRLTLLLFACLLGSTKEMSHPPLVIVPGTNDHLSSPGTKTNSFFVIKNEAEPDAVGANSVGSKHSGEEDGRQYAKKYHKGTAYNKVKGHEENLGFNKKNHGDFGIYHVSGHSDGGGVNYGGGLAKATSGGNSISKGSKSQGHIKGKSGNDHHNKGNKKFGKTDSDVVGVNSFDSYNHGKQDRFHNDFDNVEGFVLGDKGSFSESDGYEVKKGHDIAGGEAFSEHGEYNDDYKHDEGDFGHIDYGKHEHESGKKEGHKKYDGHKKGTSGNHHKKGGHNNLHKHRSQGSKEKHHSSDHKEGHKSNSGDHFNHGGHHGGHNSGLSSQHSDANHGSYDEQGGHHKALSSGQLGDNGKELKSVHHTGHHNDSHDGNKQSSYSHDGNKQSSYNNAHLRNSHQGGHPGNQHHHQHGHHIGSDVASKIVPVSYHRAGVEHPKSATDYPESQATIHDNNIIVHKGGIIQHGTHLSANGHIGQSLKKIREHSHAHPVHIYNGDYAGSHSMVHKSYVKQDGAKESSDKISDNKDEYSNENEENVGHGHVNFEKKEVGNGEKEGASSSGNRPSGYDSMDYEEHDEKHYDSSTHDQGNRHHGQHEEYEDNHKSEGIPADEQISGENEEYEDHSNENGANSEHQISQNAHELESNLKGSHREDQSSSGLGSETAYENENHDETLKHRESEGENKSNPKNKEFVTGDRGTAADNNGYDTNKAHKFEGSSHGHTDGYSKQRDDYTGNYYGHQGKSQVLSDKVQDHRKGSQTKSRDDHIHKSSLPRQHQTLVLDQRAKAPEYEGGSNSDAVHNDRPQKTDSHQPLVKSHIFSLPDLTNVNEETDAKSDGASSYELALAPHRGSGSNYVHGSAKHDNKSVALENRNLPIHKHQTTRNNYESNYNGSEVIREEHRPTIYGHTSAVQGHNLVNNFYERNDGQKSKENSESGISEMPLYTDGAGSEVTDFSKTMKIKDPNEQEYKISSVISERSRDHTDDSRYNESNNKTFLDGKLHLKLEVVPQLTVSNRSTGASGQENENAQGSSGTVSSELGLYIAKPESPSLAKNRNTNFRM